MDIKTFRHPATNFEIIKYYWPESLSGQANSATGPFNHLPDIHYMFTRENGTSTCSCGLVYWGSNLPLDSNPWGLSMDDFGHRNHQTGEYEPCHKLAVRKLEPPTEHIFECEWCRTTSIQDDFFDESKNHQCQLEKLTDSRLMWITASLEVQRKKLSLQLFDQHPESLDHGFLEIKLGLEGATISSSNPDFRETLNKMLAESQLLLSEELREVSDESSDWPSEYVNPTEKELEFFWEVEIENKSRYFLGNLEDFGYFKFSNTTFQSNSLVRYTMTKDAFIINAARSNMPIMRIPVIGF
jgi:hypothetical protein